MKNSVSVLAIVFLFLVTGCCKHKTDNVCKQSSIQLQPFVEKFGYFFCDSNDYEYTYVFTKKDQIDSLSPTCYMPWSVPYPVDETNMRYIILGRMSYHYRDSFAFTSLLVDTCNKKLVYEADMIQRDTAFYCCPYGAGGILSMFCSVENIPADYQVEVKYKYVPIQ